MIIIGQDLCENHTDGMTSHVTGTSWLKSMMSHHVQICDALSNLNLSNRVKIRISVALRPHMRENKVLTSLAAPAVRRRPCEARKFFGITRSNTPISLQNRSPPAPRHRLLLSTDITERHTDRALYIRKSVDPAKMTHTIMALVRRDCSSGSKQATQEV